MVVDVVVVVVVVVVGSINDIAGEEKNCRVGVCCALLDFRTLRYGIS